VHDRPDQRHAGRSCHEVEDGDDPPDPVVRRRLGDDRLAGEEPGRGHPRQQRSTAQQQDAGEARSPGTPDQLARLDRSEPVEHHTDGEEEAQLQAPVTHDVHRGAGEPRRRCQRDAGGGDPDVREARAGQQAFEVALRQAQDAAHHRREDRGAVQHQLLLLVVAPLVPASRPLVLVYEEVPETRHGGERRREVLREPATPSQLLEDGGERRWRP
jgi:hypothetical protein